MSARDHTYTRPAWLCLTCLTPWPCEPLRQAFLAKYQGGVERMRLRGILGALVLDAERDLCEPLGQLTDRFTAWTFDPAELP